MLDSIISSSHGMKGRSMCVDPVARITFSASICKDCPFESIEQVLGPVNVAQPWMTSAPADLRRDSTPLLSRSTMLSFHDTSPFMSRVGSPLTLIPMWPPAFECSDRDSNRSAA